MGRGGIKALKARKAFNLRALRTSMMVLVTINQEFGLAESEYIVQVYENKCFLVIQLWFVYLNVYQLLELTPLTLGQG